MTDAAPDMIRAFFERWQRLEEEKRSISDDLKDLFAEMKGAGFDTKVARRVFRDKTVDQNERAEFEAIYDLYWSALSGPSRVYARDVREEHDHETGEVHDEPATEPQRSPAAQSRAASPYSVGERLDGMEAPSTGQGGDESPVTHSPETVERGAGPATAPASDDDAFVHKFRARSGIRAALLVSDVSHQLSRQAIADVPESHPCSLSSAASLDGSKTIGKRLDDGKILFSKSQKLND